MANKEPNKKSRKNQQQNKPKVFIYHDGMIVSEVAEALNLNNAVVIKKLINLGIMANINQVLDKETVELLVLDSGYEFKEEKAVLEDPEEVILEDNPKDLQPRAPIVTVMGHVDHGKTTLLDTIRKSRVASGEAGGITQHIGAYQVKRGKNSITFIDTPGHAAFSSMRARGAQVTDIVVLVVAADDGVQPQTIEAIDHTRAAKAPLIVAINKIDKPNVHIEQTMTELAEHGVVPEAWGGDVPFVNISAKTGEGIDELLDMIELVADLEELKANPNRNAVATVVESRLDKGKGPVATIIIKTGTLKVGDNFVVGSTYGKVRTLLNDLNHPIKKAIPSQPVEVTGLQDVPEAGDQLVVYDDEKKVKEIASERVKYNRDTKLVSKAKTLESILGQLESEEKELNLIIKTDVQGSSEALSGLLEKINIEGFHVNIIRSQVGTITENDVILADASNSVIIGFNVRPTAAVRQLSKDKGIEIRLYNVIYQVQEDIELALKGMLEPTYEEVVIGQLEVREIYKISKVGTVAGCYVTDGVIKRNSKVRVIRDQIVVYEGTLATLKRFKDDVKEVKAGYECGISILNYNDIKVGDIIEVSQEREVEA